MKPNSIGLWIHLMFMVSGCVSTTLAQGIGSPVNLINGIHEKYAAQFGAGITNVPLLRMDWFPSCTYRDGRTNDTCCHNFCEVDQSGNVRQGWVCISNPGVQTTSLTRTNLEALVSTIKRLPPPRQEALSPTNEIIISGIRSNQWFHAVYNRTKTPRAVKTLHEIAGAPLDCKVR